MSEFEQHRDFIVDHWHIKPTAGVILEGETVRHVEPKVMDVLVCLVHARGQILTRDQLINDVWPGVVVGEEVLTRAISELRSLLGDSAKGSRYIKTYPKRGYSFIADVVIPDAPVSVLRSRSKVSNGGSAPAATVVTKNGPHVNPVAENPVVAILRSLIVWVVGGSCATLIIIFTSILVFQPELLYTIDQEEGFSASDNKASVAVLPFLNMSTSDQHDFFVDGLSEDIRHALVGQKYMNVVARTSSEVYRDKAVDIRDIGDQLAADLIIEGSVRVYNDTARVSVQIADTASGHPIWAGSYDRSLNDAFAIQREIAQVVSAQLQGIIQPDLIREVDPHAYESYLLGRHFWQLRTPEGLRSAKEQFEMAIARQNDYANAYAGLADVATFSTLYADVPTYEGLETAQGYVDMAMAIDPELSEAHASQGLIFQSQKKVEAAREAFERALELNPSSSMVLMWYGTILMDHGDVNLAFTQYQRALEIDPLHPVIQGNYLSALNKQGRYVEAEELSYTFYSHARSDSIAKHIAHNYFHTGRLNKLIDYVESLEPALRDSAGFQSYVIESHYRLGRIARGDSILQKWKSRMDPLAVLKLDLVKAYVQAQPRDVMATAYSLKDYVRNSALTGDLDCPQRPDVLADYAVFLEGVSAFMIDDFESAEFKFSRVAERGEWCWLEDDMKFDLELYELEMAKALGRPRQAPTGGGGFESYCRGLPF